MVKSTISCVLIFFSITLIFISNAYALTPNINDEHDKSIQPSDMRVINYFGTEGGIVLYGIDMSGNVTIVKKIDMSLNLLWNKIYNYKTLDILPSKDGGFALKGFDEDNNYNAMLIKLYNNGSIQWINVYNKTNIQTLGQFGWESNYIIISTDDGGYLIVGNAFWPGPNNTIMRGIYESDTNSTFLHIIKLHENGSIQWEQIYNGSLNPFPTFKRIAPDNIVQSNDGNYLITVGEGVYSGGLTLYDDIGLMKIDINGRVLWSKIYDLPEGYKYNIQNLIPTLDSGCLLTYGSVKPLINKITINKLDISGEEQWSTIIKDVSPVRGDMNVIFNNDVYVFNGIALIKINESDGLSWQRFIIPITQNGKMLQWFNIPNQYNYLLPVNNTTYKLTGYNVSDNTFWLNDSLFNMSVISNDNNSPNLISPTMASTSTPSTGSPILNIVTILAMIVVILAKYRNN
jgi:hypothetical protein